MRQRDNRDSKYLRLTGLWPSKNKKGLFTGKLRAQDVGKLIDKLEEADGNDIAFFLWENDQQSRKDPEFTLQCTVSDSNGYKKNRYRDEEEDDDRSSRKRRASRDADEEEQEEKEEEEVDEAEEQEEEKPRSKKSDKNEKPSKSVGKSSKKQREDW